jgi:amino acid adenylation domain-containing protein
MRYLLTQLVSDAALRDPAHPAICCRDQTLTYGDLQRRSAALARTLQASGVKVGDRVGIYMYKCVDCASAIYGIMAAGAAYVPLDPTAPLARLQHIIDSCDIEVLVTEPRLDAGVQALLPLTGIRQVVGCGEGIDPASQDVSWEALQQQSENTYPELSLTGNDLAYVLFTSGSTGVPKGIMHTHASAIAWAEVTTSSYQLTPADRISNYAPLHFDLSTLDYFGAARAGATTVMIPEEYTRFPASLAELIAREHLSIFYTVPYALLQLLQAGVIPQHRYPALRAVLFGGEPIPPKHLLEIMKLWPGADFYNVYGPTETNGVTHYPVNLDALETAKSIPIGKVYANVEALVLDSQGNTITDNSVGELLICAGTCMRGYWKRPDLNQRVFWLRSQDNERPDVFVRTGDLVSRRADGCFEFLGRADRLIKTRGYRVELDEVEASIVAHPLVVECAAFAVPDPAGSVNIAVAIIPSDPDSFDLTMLQGHIRRQLPAYAMPRSIEVRTDFPRTSTGKIDRVKLAAQATKP